MKAILAPRRLCLVSLFVATLSVLSAADAIPPAKSPRPDPWLPLRPLLGKWEGEVQGQPGSGTAEREYRFALGNSFIHIANKSIYPHQEKTPKGEIHEDTGFISYDKAAKKLVLRQFHVEGFVNQFVLESISEDGRTIVFVTTAIENIPAGWRARETYRLVGADEFVETFALAEPGKDFATYSETRFRRAAGGPAAAAPSSSTGHAAVNGTKLYYERRGAGEVVVLLQGANLPLQMWDAQFAELAREFMVIRYDVRGFGRSEPVKGQTFRAYEDLRALLDHLGVESAHLVGLSLGGRIAVDFAVECPARVRSLVLAGSGLSGWRFSPGDGWRVPIAEAVKAGDGRKAAEAWLKSPYMAPAMENPELAPRLRELAAENAAAWVDNNREEAINPAAIDRLKTVRCPTLVLVGDRDIPDIRRISDRLAHEIPGAEQEVFENIGHVLNLEAPERFTERVRQFLRKASKP